MSCANPAAPTKIFYFRRKIKPSRSKYLSRLARDLQGGLVTAYKTKATSAHAQIGHLFERISYGGRSQEKFRSPKTIGLRMRISDLRTSNTYHDYLLEILTRFLGVAVGVWE